MMAQKVNVSSSNVKSFFNYLPINTNQIKAGMLIKFAYYSPEGVHDHAPTIYVLEVEKDRIWGVNVQYNYRVLSEIVNKKKEQLEKISPVKRVTPQKPNHANEKVFESIPKLNKVLPDKKEESKDQSAKINVPAPLLETYELKLAPKEILRNYLPERMRGKFKLTFKTNI